MQRALIGIAIAVLAPQALPAQGPHLERTIPLQDVAVRYTAISPAGDFVAAVCRDQKLRVWEARSGALSQTLELSGERITSAHFSGSGELLALGGGNGRVRIFEIPSGKLKFEFTSSREVHALAFSKDAKLLATAPLEEAVEVWDLSSGKQIARMRAPFSGTSAVAFSPDSKWLATADGDTDVRVYDARTGTLRSTADDLLLEPLTIAYSTDGQQIFTGGGDKTITVIDPNSGKVLRIFPKQSDALLGLSPSKDGKLLAAAYFNADDPSIPAPVLIWDLATQTQRQRILESGMVPNGGEFLIDGRLLLTSGAKSELKIWSLR
ncbi:MAG: WD40 repeat domain-containing protein [Acidobacteriota bacterium]|nr:WD40 repeat domain-containing protein [Acidobacteriota bacterium]